VAAFPPSKNRLSILVIDDRLGVRLYTAFILMLGASQQRDGATHPCGRVSVRYSSVS
jgi:hypothetical protein